MSMPLIDTFESVKQVVPDGEITGSNAEETVVTRFANKSSLISESCYYSLFSIRTCDLTIWHYLFH